MSAKLSIGVRLAIRHEGAFVNAYLAREDTMEGATLLGSILASIAHKGDRWDAWKKLMTEAVADAVEEVFGHRPDMPERPAPEHERGGAA
jgi:hypothetical protein